MIRFALDSDLPALHALWQEAFEAEVQEAEHYFAHRHRHENMLVALRENEVAGMLSMLPISLVTQEKTLPARYVFAVATFRKFRGQGISSQLMEAAHAHMQKEGMAASLLVPASKSLFDFYRKRGYETRFWLDSLSLSAHDIAQPPPDAIISPLRAKDYFRLRNQAFSVSALFARWDEEALAFMIASAREDGGGALYIKTSQGKACPGRKRWPSSTIT